MYLKCLNHRSKKSNKKKNLAWKQCERSQTIVRNSIDDRKKRFAVRMYDIYRFKKIPPSKKHPQPSAKLPKIS